MTNSNNQIVKDIITRKTRKHLQFSHSVGSDSLQPHGLQHTRPPCPSPTPGVCSNSCPLSQWCHPTISSPVTPFSPAFNLPQRQGLFQWVSISHQVVKVLELQLQHQSFQWIFRTNSLYHWLVWFPCSPRDSQKSSSAPPFKVINSLVLSLFLLSSSHICTWLLGKHSFDSMDFCRQSNVFCFLIHCLGLSLLFFQAADHF